MTKGHHVHVGDQQLPYEYVSDDKLIEDFKRLVFEHMRVTI